MLDPFDCYELCVQSPRHVVSFLRAVHGNEPRILHEDFCGTAAVSRRWCADAASRGETARAVCVDIDARSLDRAAMLARADGTERSVVFVRADVLQPVRPPPNPLPPGGGADVVFVGNFSIGYIHTRPALVAYLRHARERLARGASGFGGGVFVCDTYGGAGAFRLGAIERNHPSRGRELIRYSWVHEDADPITAMVTNSISFRVVLDGEVVAEYPRAFEYRWRLWSIAELREAMLEAGFVSVEVHKDVNLAPEEPPRPVSDPRDLGEDWVVLVVARA
ncbi:MAG: hypothetical protein HBSAPP03_11250 [Phycisphaerae bacterium]|nr:MAG: hypothetical protein HBSAPP03_11250 [Phycisphaerae bacterium]